jgi:hypothetical protein
MSELLQEYCDSRGAAMRVDAQAGVIRGVKVLGLESRNGRSYLPEALAEAARLYENAKVNVNHPKGNPAGPRDYQDRIGTIRGVALRPGEGLFGDFHFNPKHALAEQLIWDAQHAPENVGFSHNVEARTSRHGERVVVEAITRVQSVDLVADPATTRGLFEAAGGEPTKRLSLDDLKREHPELIASIGREHAAEVSRLRQEVERLTALEAVHQKRAAARRMLREFGLPDPQAAEPLAETLCGQRFIESLLSAVDEGVMRELVEERARLVRTLTGQAAGSAASRPQSRDQHLVYGVPALDAKSFVEAIT